ncbi:MAG: excinuclease ABC subunit B, partial [Clostridia bacterium]|nr:excinuclease ABC subunit B [Clostridia bacterium]
LDADKEGFLRSESSLIQTIGRAARNAQGRVIMYADNITGSMQRAIDETNRRRVIQNEYNQKHGITPKTISHETKNTLAISKRVSDATTLTELRKQLADVVSAMKISASNLDFERAIVLREQADGINSKIKKLEEKPKKSKK